MRVRYGVIVGRNVTIGVLVGLLVGVAVAVGVDVLVGVAVDVGIGVRVDVEVGDGVSVGVGVFVGVGVAVGNGVRVEIMVSTKRVATAVASLIEIKLLVKILPGLNGTFITTTDQLITNVAFDVNEPVQPIRRKDGS